MKISDKLKDHILDSIAEGVMTVDKNFRIHFFNRAAERIIGYKREEVIGQFCKNVFKSGLCYVDCPISTALKSRKNVFDFEANVESRDGKTIPIKLNAAVLYNDENVPTGGIISFRDISELEKIKKSIEKASDYHGIIGRSKKMREIFDLIEEIKDSDASVLIQGESGTGKEVIADAIQKSSGRSNKPYIKVNVSVFPPHLLASELFGHVKGAFTDAVRDRAGRFELADGGTLFLDEVAEMPLQMQPQLLRVLQEGTFERVGESVTRKVDVRVIAATNRNVEEALKQGVLREDLYYRLNVIPITIPPLRERPEDLEPLVRFFIRRFSITYKKEITDIEDAALDILSGYDWPGNVRELENAIEYAFVRSNGNIITAWKLPAQIREKIKANIPVSKYYSCDDEPERKEILDVLDKHKWNKTKAARELGIGRTTLWRKMRKLKIID